MAMTPSRSALAPLLGCAAVLVASSLAAASLQSGSDDASSLSAAMATRANALLAAFDEARASHARSGHDDPERSQWAFGPVQREGVALGAMSDEHRKALDALLDTALSAEGMRVWGEVRAQEVELHRLESKPGRPATHRDPNLYWVRVYGTPGADQRWSWRVEGHHFALHVDCKPGRTPSVTPFFVGANPLFVEGEDGKESLGVGLFGTMNERYRALRGALGDGVGAGPDPRPADVRMAPGKDDLPPADGVALGDVALDARVKTLSLLDHYLALLEPALRTPYAIDPERSSKVHFAHWGGADLREARAWAVRAPRFAFEVLTTEGPHHVHALLRDPERDFGGK